MPFVLLFLCVLAIEGGKEDERGLIDGWVFFFKKKSKKKGGERAWDYGDGCVRQRLCNSASRFSFFFFFGERRVIYGGGCWMAMTPHSLCFQNSWSVSGGWRRRRRSSRAPMSRSPLSRSVVLFARSASVFVNPQELVDVIRETNSWRPQDYVGLHCGDCVNIGMIKR